MPVSHARHDLGGEIYATVLPPASLFVSMPHETLAWKPGVTKLRAMIRNGWFLVLQNGVEALKTAKTFPNHPANKPLEPHIEHCFDYLHQTLRCNADSTLEFFLG